MMKLKEKILYLQTESMIKKRPFKGGVFKWGAIVENVRNVFVEKNNTSIYIPKL